MGVVAVYGNFIRNVVKDDDSVEQNKPDKNQQTQCKVIKHELAPFESADVLG
ncbi:hypothetical protein D3C81_1995570 [compost metagenome]|jgi:hypothetical protein